jgi:hypothetical protein
MTGPRSLSPETGSPPRNSPARSPARLSAARPRRPDPHAQTRPGPRGANRGPVYFEMGAPGRAALDELARRLGGPHGPVLRPPAGWVLPDLYDPDGNEMRFYVTGEGRRRRTGPHGCTMLPPVPGSSSSTALTWPRGREHRHTPAPRRRAANRDAGSDLRTQPSHREGPRRPPRRPQRPPSAEGETRYAIPDSAARRRPTRTGDTGHPDLSSDVLRPGARLRRQPRRSCCPEADCPGTCLAVAGRAQGRSLRTPKCYGRTTARLRRAEAGENHRGCQPAATAGHVTIAEEADHGDYGYAKPATRPAQPLSQPLLCGWP